MNPAPLHVTLPEPLSQRVLALATVEGIAPDQFLLATLTETIGRLEAERRMEERAARGGNWERFQRILAQAPDVEPELESDRISPELAARLDAKFGEVR